MLRCQCVLANANAVPAGCLALSLASISVMAQGAKTEFYVGIALMGAGTAMSSSAINSLISDLAKREESGSVSGAMDVVQSICRVGAPLVGGLLQQYGALSAPWAAGAVLSAIGAAILLRLSEPEPAPAPEPTHKKNE